MQVDDILNSLNIISEKLFKSVEGEIYEVLDNIVIIGKDILTKEPLKNIFFENNVNGIIIIANSILLFIFIYYIFSILLSFYNGNKVENVYSFVLKMLIITLVVNNSYYICEQILSLMELLSNSINEFSKSIIKQEVTFVNLKEAILSIKDFMQNDLLSIDGLIKGVVSFGAISILINFSIRYVTVIFLVIISPLAIACASSNLSRGITTSWSKLLFTNLLEQIIVKLVLLIPLSYKEVDSVMYKIILVGTIYILYRINNFTRDFTAHVSSNYVKDNIFRR